MLATRIISRARCPHMLHSLPHTLPPPPVMLLPLPPHAVHRMRRLVSPPKGPPGRNIITPTCRARRGHLKGGGAPPYGPPMAHGMKPTFGTPEGVLGFTCVIDTC